MRILRRCLPASRIVTNAAQPPLILEDVHAATAATHYVINDIHCRCHSASIAEQLRSPVSGRQREAGVSLFACFPFRMFPFSHVLSGSFEMTNRYTVPAANGGQLTLTARAHLQFGGDVEGDLTVNLFFQEQP
jgi:hypothetical protein